MKPFSGSSDYAWVGLHRNEASETWEVGPQMGWLLEELCHRLGDVGGGSK